jgi:hypothetical protein
MRFFIAGTGGADAYADPGPAERNGNIEVVGLEFGVLQLSLRARGYSWRFLPIDGATFTDSGDGVCHDAPP